MRERNRINKKIDKLTIDLELILTSDKEIKTPYGSISHSGYIIPEFDEIRESFAIPVELAWREKFFKPKVSKKIQRNKQIDDLAQQYQ